ncbi:hypothetical protein [Streptomyces sp. NPDC088847]|uniref:hypothetical protein n=1 Tax=Streptomyces sp. NPDC088847 TaxID=3365909 RepID=UPI003813A790
MKLVELEIAQWDWAGMDCGCGRSAEHVAELLLEVARGQSRGVAGALDGHVWSSPTLFGPAPAVASVAMAALADNVPLQARAQFLDLVQLMVAGEGTDFGSAAQGLDLPQLCREITARGHWLLYGEVVSGRSVMDAGAAFEILTVVEENRGRLQALRERAGEFLPWHCRTGLCDDDLVG